MRTSTKCAAAIGAVLTLAALSLAGCSGREDARSADYFAAHEADARAVVDGCTAGTTRGAECDNARDGLRTIAGKRTFAPAKVSTTDGKEY